MNKNIFIISLFLVILSQFLLFSDNKNPKDERGMKKSNLYEKKGSYKKNKLNTKDTFKNVKTNDIVAFIVGNDNYMEISEFSPLNQCINDTKLISQILKICCKVPEKNIIIGTNLTAKEFREKFKEIAKNLKKTQGFFFSYSGHGDMDGSLVFIDGEKITPEELKNLVNSFPNDTLMMLDACYSGNNEGPLDKNETVVYKENCIRVYASLAHMTAKEISYSNEYFAYIMPFYEDVLELKDKNKIDGNGYFTSFIGYFFAEYDFAENENISIRDLLTYISNKSKQYVEYLAMRGKSARSFANESDLRLDQQPKIFPLRKRVRLQDPNHEFILINKYIEPVGISPEFYAGPFITFTTLFQFRVSSMESFRISYGPSFLKGLFFGFETGHLFIYREENKEQFLQQIVVNMIPFIGIIGFKHQFLETNNILSIKVDGGAGVALSIWHGKEFLNVPQEIYTNANFIFLTSAGIGLHPIKELTIGIDISLSGILLLLENENNLLLGLRIPVYISYKF